VDVARKYFFNEPGWVLGSLWTQFKSLLVLCAVGEDRVAKIRYSAMGLIDGLCSKFDRKLG
jgi:hypothetical protein